MSLFDLEGKLLFVSLRLLLDFLSSLFEQIFWIQNFFLYFALLIFFEFLNLLELILGAEFFASFLDFLD